MTRGTGRTWKQLEALPKGSLFIVHDRGMKLHAEDLLLKMGKFKGHVEIVVAKATFEVERATQGKVYPAVDADHHWKEIATPRMHRAFDQSVGLMKGRTT